MSEARKPRTLKELIDREREKLRGDAHSAMMTPSVDAFSHGVQVGKYQAIEEFLNRIENMMTSKEDEE